MIIDLKLKLQDMAELTYDLAAMHDMKIADACEILYPKISSFTKNELLKLILPYPGSQNNQIRRKEEK